MNPSVHALAEQIIHVTSSRWNRVVGKRCIRMAQLDTERTICVLHPTKGFRHISRSRVGF